MADLVGSFMDDTDTEQVDEDALVKFSLPDTLLPEIPFSQAEAVACDKRIDSTARAFYEELRQMRDRQGWRVLGFSSWESYLRKKAEKSGVDRSTIIKRLQAGDVRQELTEQGVSVRGVSDVQARELDKLETPEQKAAALRLAQEMSESNPPEGKGGEFHRPGKIYTDYVKQAVETLLPPADDESDPFNPNTRNSVAHKPMPPKQASAPISHTDRELADFICCEYKPGADVMFISFRVAPGEEYESWVPVREIREALGK